ncbi:hypothetical protein SAMN04489732_109290 [Amycolatopsis saalfeldensis]|uniref:Uncharacterized protein n=1 Tax=Amycolatopsis saalfeldensis TaxID=394193 RepID=A0A1H8XXY6_9PSEU|nr:hypothetical protein SAMN04489732_109290 [Amycolatopsis saalfeldensis]
MTDDPTSSQLALEAVKSLARILPRPFHVLGVEKARAAAAGPRPGDRRNQSRRPVP